jgi:5-methylthioribose kinase
MNEKLRDIFLRAVPSEPIVNIHEVAKGDVHYVFKICGQNANYYLKQRKNHLKRYPEVTIDPKAIADEVRALLILHAAFPESFPKVIFFDEKNSSVLMEDILPDG